MPFAAATAMRAALSWVLITSPASTQVECESSEGKYAACKLVRQTQQDAEV